jgi:putative nucleotidyltransferase with HDIG domain
VDEVAVFVAVALARAVEAKDGATADHTLRVADLAVRLAQAMGMDQAGLLRVRVGALLHDVGKLAVPDRILLKPGPLTAREWAVMARHPAAGARLLRGIQSLATVRPTILHHHERWDGAGYPHGLVGDAIPVEARIVAVADAFVAMTEDRPYRPALSLTEAMRQIRRGGGAQFDPALVCVTVRIFEEAI